MVLAGNGDGQSSCGENPGARPEFEEQQVDFLVAGWRFGWRTNGDNSVREKLSSQAFRPNAPFENVDCQWPRTLSSCPFIRDSFFYAFLKISCPSTLSSVLPSLMPKSNPTLSPATNNAQPPSVKSSPDDAVNKLSDVALRKKKNADAQAAFRARRANYIATLEETVTSLESVVLQVQESWRESRREANNLRTENAYLRYEYCEREKFWRALWSAKKSGPEELPPMPPLYHACAQPMSLPISLNGQLNLQQYIHGQPGYRAGNDAAPVGYGGPGQQYQNHATPLPYGTTNADITGESAQVLNARLPKYGGYTYGLQNSADLTNGSQTSHTPPFGESPTVTPDMSYIARFPGEEQKVPMNGVEPTPLVFHNSRSLSPTSTPGSASTTSLTSPFQFAYPENSVGQDRTDFDYRRHPHSHASDVAIHGGTADMALGNSTADATRYRLGTKRSSSCTERPLLPGLPFVAADTCSRDRGSNDENCTIYSNSRLRSRRAVTSRASRSPSPPPLSGTLAVIKAQTFGALRRTRARTKKASEGAAKVAMDVLESRGIGHIGTGGSAGTKRQRLHNDSTDTERS